MAVAACSSRLGKTFGVVTDPGLGRVLRQSSMHPGPLESHLNLTTNTVPSSTPAFARACAHARRLRDTTRAGATR